MADGSPRPSGGQVDNSNRLLLLLPVVFQLTQPSSEATQVNSRLKFLKSPTKEKAAECEKKLRLTQRCFQSNQRMQRDFSSLGRGNCEVLVFSRRKLLVR